MRRSTPLALLFAAVTAVVGVVAVLRSRAENRKRALELLAASRGTDRIVTRSDYADTPEPVKRYFDTVLSEGRPYVRRVSMAQRGSMRLGGPDAAWRPMQATQHYTTEPPGFVWDATIDVLPYVPARVLDEYREGEGRLRAKLLSTVPVASAGPSDAMAESELLRYLGEAVWFPTALLPTEGVEWDAIDDRTARATISDGDTTASMVFHFGVDGLVTHVTAERYRQETGDTALWTGYFRSYVDHDGLTVPTEAEVEWDLPEGPLPYWRAELERLDVW